MARRKRFGEVRHHGAAVRRAHGRQWVGKGGKDLGVSIHVERDLRYVGQHQRANAAPRTKAGFTAVACLGAPWRKGKRGTPTSGTLTRGQYDMAIRRKWGDNRCGFAVGQKSPTAAIRKALASLSRRLN